MIDEKEMKWRAELHQKLNKARAEIGTVAKKGKTNQYVYAKAEDIIRAARTVLIANNLSIVPRVVNTGHTDAGETKAGTAQKFTALELIFEITDTMTGYSIEIPWSGDGQDFGDKGIYKALTGGNKYFLVILLAIPTGDDPEAKNDAPQQRTTARPTGPAQTAQRTTGGGQQANTRAAAATSARSDLGLDDGAPIHAAMGLIPPRDTEHIFGVSKDGEVVTREMVIEQVEKLETNIVELRPNYLIASKEAMNKMSDEGLKAHFDVTKNMWGEIRPKCETCGKNLEGFTDPDGKYYSPAKLTASRGARFQKVLCTPCVRKLREGRAA